METIKNCVVHASMSEMYPTQVCIMCMNDNQGTASLEYKYI